VGTARKDGTQQNKGKEKGAYQKDAGGREKPLPKIRKKPRNSSKQHGMAAEPRGVKKYKESGVQ